MADVGVSYLMRGRYALCSFITFSVRSCGMHDQKFYYFIALIVCTVRTALKTPKIVSNESKESVPIVYSTQTIINHK